MKRVRFLDHQNHSEILKHKIYKHEQETFDHIVSLILSNHELFRRKDEDKNWCTVGCQLRSGLELIDDLFEKHSQQSRMMEILKNVLHSMLYHCYSRYCFVFAYKQLSFLKYANAQNIVRDLKKPWPYLFKVIKLVIVEDG